VVGLQDHKPGSVGFKLTGSEQRNGTTLVKVTYEEVARPTIIRTSSDRDIPVKGYGLVNADDGSVFETRMRVESFSSGSRLADRQMVFAKGQGANLDRVPSHAEVTVTYGFDARLGLLLPVSMEQSYQGESWEPGVRDDRPRDTASAVQ
jgi:hypothetical protein